MSVYGVLVSVDGVADSRQLGRARPLGAPHARGDGIAHQDHAFQRGLRAVPLASA
jgi:hypothetical protein